MIGKQVFQHRVLTYIYDVMAERRVCFYLDEFFTVTA